jgi:hypothetical protein
VTSGACHVGFQRTVAAAVVFLLCSVMVFAATPSTARLNVNPTDNPIARESMALAYDPVSQRVVMFGGFNKQGWIDETWLFDGTTWVHVIPQTSPPRRAGTMMAFDRVSGKLVLFGGFDGHNFLTDTWLWDGATMNWTQATPQTSPPPLSTAMLFTDSANGH